MRRWLFVSAFALFGLLGTANKAPAMWFFTGPYYTSAAFPCVYPPGYYSNLYYYAWYYPWYSYYNYSHGSFANWYLWNGWATYGGNCGPYGCGPKYPYGMPGLMQAGEMAPTQWKPPVAATLTVNVPADAKLMFNGAEAAGTGGARVFRTAPLQRNYDYAYDLTAEVVRDGQVKRVTKRVVFHAGDETTVTLTPGE